MEPLDTPGTLIGPDEVGQWGKLVCVGFRFYEWVQIVVVCLPVLLQVIPILHLLFSSGPVYEYIINYYIEIGIWMDERLYYRVPRYTEYGVLYYVDTTYSVLVLISRDHHHNNSKV